MTSLSPYVYRVVGRLVQVSSVQFIWCEQALTLVERFVIINGAVVISELYLDVTA